MSLVTDGALLGGRVRYRQQAAGYRTGIEPVLLAACVDAEPGQSVLEAGTGAGAAMLCLLARVPGVRCHGVERDPALAALARCNLDDNGFADATVETADVAQAVFTPRFHHAVANPPWHAATATASADPLRDAAKRGTPKLLATWAAALAGALVDGGSLTMIVPAAETANALAAMAACRCGSPALLPLWPRAGRPARLMLVRAFRSRRGACTVLPGLALHDDDGYSPAARAILWDAAPLVWT